jgi:signal transduction histidine kinase
MHIPSFALFYLLYGLAFFSMGLAIILELGRGTDARLRHALRPLAAFGMLHGIHEWLEMFEGLQLLPGQDAAGIGWTGLRLAILAFSFLSLGAFGASLYSPNETVRRMSMLVPLGQATVWGFGLLVMRGHYPLEGSLFPAAEAWTRYVLAIPSSLLASLGLIAQQRRFRQAGMAQFGRDSLWAAVAFAWYGVLGQAFPRASALPPSTVLNQDLFLLWFGFPVQIVRGVAALAASVFVIRFLRSFEVEIQRHIAQLQAARLREAERREALRGELLGRVVSAQEAERQRIARELHDETGQALTAIGMGLRGVSSTLAADPGKAGLHLRRLEILVGRALDELQRLIADLRPSHLDDLGLPAAVRWYAGEAQNRAGVPIHVEILGTARPISATVNTALFRVVQEAITNVVKHAQAHAVTVSLEFAEGEVRVQVKDDGRGFEPAGLANHADRPAWGLLGMRERAALLGGHMSLRSAAGEGTIVEVRIPDAAQPEVKDEEPIAVGG